MLRPAPILAPALLALACAVALGACQRTDPPAADANATATPAADAAPAAAEPTAQTPRTAATDLEQLAERIVTQTAAVKEGEVVFISGQSHDAELLENLAVQVRKVGAFPLVTYSSDRLSKRLFFDVPDKYDTQADTLGMKIASLLDVSINVGNQLTQDLFADADPARMAARGKAGEAVNNAFVKEGIRVVDIGNGLYPTPWRAERFGLGEDALAKTFWDGVNVDYTQLQARADQVKAALAGGDAMHITNPNGTDLKLRVGGRKVMASDGIISADDVKQGGGALMVYLPAGEVYTTPVAGTAEGKVVHSRTYYQGKEVTDLTMTFVGGKLTALTGAGDGFAAWKAAYDAVTDPRKNEFAFVDFGINPNVTLPAAAKVGNWVSAGSVSVGIGGNAWAGGSNTVSYSETVFLPGSTVMLDGKPIVENGVLKI